MGTDPGKSILDSSDFLIRAGVVKFCRFCYDGWTNRGVFHAEMEANFVRSAASGGGWHRGGPPSLEEEAQGAAGRLQGVGEQAVRQNGTNSASGVGCAVFLPDF